MPEKLVLGSKALDDIKTAKQFEVELLKQIIQQDTKLETILPKSDEEIKSLCTELRKLPEWNRLVQLEKTHRGYSLAAKLRIQHHLVSYKGGDMQIEMPNSEVVGEYSDLQAVIYAFLYSYSQDTFLNLPGYFNAGIRRTGLAS